MAAEDISTLVLQVKSDGIKDGTDQLNALTDAATKAEGAAKKLSSGMAQGEAATRKASGSAKAMAEAEDTATRAVGAAVTAYQKKVVEQRRQLELYSQSGRAYAQANAEAIRMNNALNASTAAMAKAHEQALRMNAAIDARKNQAAIVAQETDALRQKAIAQQRDVEMYNQQGKAYAQAHAEALKMNKAMEDNTKGHGSNAGAIREVMVLMHELSQGSFKRFGGSMMVLTNQLDLVPKALEFIKTSSIGTIAGFATLGLGIGAVIAGIGMLVVGLIQGSRQFYAFNNALLQTGNYAGTTVDGLRNIASAAAGTHMSIGVAKDAVTQLAASGRFTASQMTLLASSATAVEEAFGVSVEKTVGEFETLSKMAITNTSRSTNVIAQHVLTMNQHYHFLTTAQFEYIVQLEKEGKAVEAAKFATETFAKVQKERAEESLKSLGYVAQAWHGIKNAISGAMDAIGRVGAKKTLEEEMTALQAARTKMSRSFATDEAANRSAGLQAINAAIIKKQVEIDNEKAKVEKQGQEQQTRERQIGAENRLNNMIAMNDKEFKKNQELAELKQHWDDATDKYRLDHAKEYEKAKAKIIADAQDKVPKGTDTSAADRDGAVDHLKETNRAKLEAIDGFITLSKERARKEGANRWFELSERERYYKEERESLQATLEAEEAIYDKYAHTGKHTPRELAVNANKKQAAIDSTKTKKEGINRDENKDREDVLVAEDQELDKLEKKQEAGFRAESKRIADLVKAERNRLAGINELKSAKEAAMAVAEDDQANGLEHEYAVRAGMIDLMKDAGLWSDRRVAIEEAGLATLGKEISGRRTLAGIYREESVKSKAGEEAARVTKNLDNGLAAAKRFEKGLVQAFGNVGKAIGGMAVAFAQMAKDRDTAQETFNKSSLEDKASGEAQAKLESDRVSANLNGYGDMAEAAKGFFDEKSKGYKIADGIAKAFHVAELARNAIAIVSNLATGASAMFKQSGWGGFAGVAAMAATMAAFGISVAGSKNEGGHSAQEVQKTQGTGSVFGDMGTKNADGTVTYKDKSESIQKALDGLKDSADMMLPVNEAMLSSLQNIEASMTGLTNLIVRTPGVTDASNMNIKTGILSGGDGVTNLVASIGEKVFGKNNILGTLSRTLSNLYSNTKQTIVDSGLQYGGKVSDLQGGKGYGQYASVDTTKSSFFGLSKSTTNKVQTQGLSDELSQQFGMIFTNLESTLKLAAGTLGTSGKAVGDAIENMVISTSQVSLKGLSGDDLTKAINAQISKTMDEIAQKAYPAMDAFRHVGEGYAQTVIRVASGVEQANNAMEKIGLTAIGFASIVDKSGDVASEIAKQTIALKEGASGIGDIMSTVTGSLSDVTSAYTGLVAAREKMKDVGLGDGLNMQTLKGAGDMKSLTDGLGKYYDKFFTEGQKVAIETENMTEQFAAIGLTLPKSRTEMRSWIEAAMKAGDQLQVGKLLSLAGGFDTLKAAIEEMTGTTSEIADQYGKEAIKLTKQGYDDATTAAEAAFSTLETMIKDEKERIKTTVDGLKDMLKSVADAIKATSPSVTAAQKFAGAMEVINDAISSVRGGGDVTKLTGLEDALKTVSDNKDDSYSTLLDFNRSQAAAYNALTELQNAGQHQLTEAEKTLATLDQQLDTAKQQLDELKGINSGMSTIGEALDNFANALATANSAKSAYTATVAGSNGAGTAAAVESLYKTVLGRSSDAGGKAYWIDAINNQGVSVSQAAKFMMDSDEYKHLPSFDVGTNHVPEDMIAKIHKGERIIPAADNEQLKKTLQDSADGTGKDTSSLEAKIDDLIQVIQQGDVANVQKTAELFKIVRDWNSTGMPAVRSDT